MDATATVNPLTRQILQRRGTDTSEPRRAVSGAEEGGSVRSARTLTGESGTAASSSTAASDAGESALSGLTLGSLSNSSIARDIDRTGQERARGKRASLLSRIFKNPHRSSDDESEAGVGEGRDEGFYADAFSQPIGYVPEFPEPPKYIRMRSHGKQPKAFDRLFLAQELNARPRRRSRTPAPAPDADGPLPPNKSGAVWALQFSKDGRYLATAGQDRIVRIWRVISSPDDRAAFGRAEDEDNDADDSDSTEDSAAPSLPRSRRSRSRSR
ncbi:uncharacterized protein V1510DRAFT_420656, partial [Dipodascopsis tothii]|uniref:uncharacterized protein n=1 Tax=Dipodascopsis tothii TaxID=44089 RepID=UPI0034CDEBDA